MKRNVPYARACDKRRFFSLPRYITHIILYKSIAMDRIAELNSSRINEIRTYVPM